MEIQYGLNLSTGCRDVDFKPESNFYSPKAKTSGRNYKVSLNQFIHTINAVFGNGGDYSDVAKELGITNSAVYSRSISCGKQSQRFPRLITVLAIPLLRQRLFSLNSASTSN